jgi:hypothetical protein
VTPIGADVRSAVRWAAAGPAGSGQRTPGGSGGALSGSGGAERTAGRWADPAGPAGRPADAPYLVSRIETSVLPRASFLLGGAFFNASGSKINREVRPTFRSVRPDTARPLRAPPDPPDPLRPLSAAGSAQRAAGPAGRPLAAPRGPGGCLADRGADIRSNWGHIGRVRSAANILVEQPAGVREQQRLPRAEKRTRSVRTRSDGGGRGSPQGAR